MNYRMIILAGLMGLLFSCEEEISVDQSEKFIKFFGSYSLDQATDVAVLDNGGFAISGIASTGSGTEMVLIVTDEYGNLRSGFPKYYTDEGLNSGANSMVVIRGGQGGFLLCGYIEESSGVTNPPKDLFIVRTSSNGQEMWKKRYGSSEEDESILHATEGISSGFMLAGYRYRNEKKDIMIMGLKEEGDSLKLSLNYNNPFSDKASANYILNTGDRYLCVCTYDKIGSAGTDILILNFDDELSPNDEIMEGNFDESAKCIVPDDDEKYLVLGNRINVNGKSEIIVHLIETDGLLVTNSLLLATISERNSDLTAERFVKMEDGSFAIIGTRHTDGNRDIFLQFLQEDYQVADRIIFGSDGNQLGVDLDIPATGGLILLGTNGFEGNSMISLIKTDDTGSL